MAPSKDTTPETTNPSQPAEQSRYVILAAPAAFDWDTLGDVLVMPNKVGTPSTVVDVMTTVPAAIRRRAEANLAANAIAVAKVSESTARKPRPDYVWVVQPVPTREIGLDFCGHLVQYAKYRPASATLEYAHLNAPRGQVTARFGEPSWYVNGLGDVPVAATEAADGAYLGVRWSVRPFENRSGAARLPGTAAS
jgi:hypothetical protein